MKAPRDVIHCYYPVMRLRFIAASLVCLGARVRTSIFGRGRNLGEFGRTLSERKDLIGKCL
jgi:hypothetical protein